MTKRQALLEQIGKILYEYEGETSDCVGMKLTLLEIGGDQPDEVWGWDGEKFEFMGSEYD